VNDVPGAEVSPYQGAPSIGLSGADRQNAAADRAAETDFGRQSTPLVAVSGVSYSVDSGSRQLQILKNVTFGVAAAEVVAIVGPSGSGKTSLLMLVAGLERPTSGQIVVAGQDLSQLSEDGLALFRRRTLGIVFQSFHLIPSLTALDNVGLALEIASPQLSRAQTREAAAAALVAVGLGDRMAHRPAALSGGEQQRVGLARAMVAKPRLLLADEPTGNLDQETGAMVIDLMFDIARRQNTAVVLITHDRSLAARADRTLTMTQGELVEAGRGAA
jgi:putative ABC transport system ATP-binding protein